MKKEEQKILKMVEAKTITPEEAAQLLHALKKIDELESSNLTFSPKQKLYLKVFSEDSPRAIFEMTMPLKWAHQITPFTAGFIQQEADYFGFVINVHQLMDEIKSGQFIGKHEFPSNKINQKAVIYIA